MKILANVRPNETLSEWYARFRHITASLLRYLGATEEIVAESLSEISPEHEVSGLECDFCPAKLPWGYDTWQCTRCPVRYDVCQECRANGRSEPGLCFVHSAETPTDHTYESFMPEANLWRIVALLWPVVSQPT